MTNRRPGQRSRPPLFTPLQGAILILCGLLVCLLAGIVVYVSGFFPGNAAVPGEPAAQAGFPTATRLPNLRPVRSMPPTYTPTPPSAPARPTHTLTPTLPGQRPPEACVPANTEILLGQVTAVLDGESIQVETMDGEPLTIVYAGITAPPEAAALNSELVAGQQVVIVKEVSDVDELGRLPAYVLAGDRFINYELIRRGYARSLDLPELACAQVFQNAEVEAQTGRLGLWEPTRIPTLTFVPTVGYNPGDLAGCDCSVKWTCSDFNSQPRAQACLNACNDYNSRLDEDRDGLACQ